MTRRSKREVERAIDELDVSGGDEFTDAGEGVTAPFVTYEDGSSLTEDDAPEGWTSSTKTGRGGVTYDVLERVADGSDGGESA